MNYQDEQRFEQLVRRIADETHESPCTVRKILTSLQNNTMGYVGVSPAGNDVRGVFGSMVMGQPG